MLIGIDASRAAPLPAGPERYAREIVRHLLQLPEARRHNWRLYTDRPGGEALYPPRTPGAAQDNVEVCNLPWRRMWTHRVLAGELRRRPPDALFVPSHVIPFAPTPSRLPPSVVTIHDLGYHVFPAAHTWRQRAYLTWSTRWSAAVARRVIAVSQATAADLQRYYATSPAKIRVIHEAVAAMPAPSQGEIAAARRLWSAAALRPLHRLHPAAQEPRPLDRCVYQTVSAGIAGMGFGAGGRSRLAK